MKATAKAPANIAFIKYWGRKDEKLRLPVNTSISMNLSGVFTVTTVEFSRKLKKDEIEILKESLGEEEKERIINHLDRIRSLGKIPFYAKVVTKNNFPKGTGIASSASGFAALTVAASTAAGLKLNQKQLSILARQGSGSACRSIPDGFVKWKAGNSSQTSYAYSIFPPDWWDLRDIIVVLGKTPKKVSSSEGHVLAESSPFYKPRILGMKDKTQKLKAVLKEKNFRKFGEIIEEEAINMHAVMMTSQPPLFYWLPETMKIILATQNWRDMGLEVFFTIDAGPNVHLICQDQDERKMVDKIKKLGFTELIINKPSVGARLKESHLF